MRELGVLCSWAERSHLIKDAAARLYNGRAVVLDEAVRVVEEELPSFALPVLNAHAQPPAAQDLYAGSLQERWTALVTASHTWPLLKQKPGPAAWPEQETRSPWQ
ncbi:hypothetical protein [Streptomyces violaceus]|uniref:Uncharacterized protein n=1 Tax=Streptomyces violaceus TaxID=1936 RepID=A0ABY9UKZ0_STRVL|nr:hypothetical protein [Streptomyces janthinus]WND23530.1 hypothetical protein RI060_42170 [Streptomyces janthinus]GGS98421.1 hypothetical protein GCM10010270_82990 [Streptomyces janthinus]